MDVNDERLDDLEKKLDRLISEAGKLHEEPFERPDDEAIDACLLGNASEAQICQVQAALRASSAFRREVRSHLRDLERLQDAKTRRKAELYEVPPMPDFSKHVFPGRDAVDAGERIDSAESAPSTPQPVAVDTVLKRTSSGWEKITRMFELPRLIPTVAVAAVLIFVVVKFMPRSPVQPPPSDSGNPSHLEPDNTPPDSSHQGHLPIIPRDQTHGPTPVDSGVVTSAPPSHLVLASLTEVNAQLEPQALSSFATRGRPTSAKDLSMWEDSTALEAIGKALELDQSTYLYHSVTTTPPSASATMLTLRLVNSEGQSNRVLSLRGPENSDSCAVWILDLSGAPTYRLFTAPLVGNTLNLLWTKRIGSEGVVTLTYRVKGKYHATPAQSFKL